VQSDGTSCTYLNLQDMNISAGEYVASPIRWVQECLYEQIMCAVSYKVGAGVFV